MPVPEFLKEPTSLYDIAEQYWDLKAYPTQYFFSLLALVGDDQLEREKCAELASPAGQEDWLNYSRRPKRTPLEVLQDFHRTASKLTIEVVFELFSSIKPRSFSIASSALVSPARLDVLVAVVEYRTVIKRPRRGLASNWLKGLEPGDRLYGWIKKGSFQFAGDHIPHIMVGPGTGLAPFRSFFQERRCRGAAAADTLHLFFGCRYREKDFHCGRELTEMADAGQLTLYCAFSRDQERKIYVQHRISENSQLLWQLIHEREARVLVSGSARGVADGVRDALARAACGAGGLAPEQGRRLLEQMEKENRYQVETW